MIPLNFLIKPASGACNMRCKYCFYENEVVIRKEDHLVFMTLDTAQLLICQAFSCIESEKRGERIQFLYRLPFKAESLHWRDWIFLINLLRWCKPIMLGNILFSILSKQMGSY